MDRMSGIANVLVGVLMSLALIGCRLEPTALVEIKRARPGPAVYKHDYDKLASTSYILDLSHAVVDPNKAVEILSRNKQTYLVDNCGR